MDRPKVFISSTYADLMEIRSELNKFFKNIGFNPVLFERGGVCYEPNNSIEKSCENEICNSHMFILVVGGRYGSPSSGKEITNKLSQYNSYTKIEYQAAEQFGVPVYVFIRDKVLIDFETYYNNPKDIRDKINFAHVDNIQVFKLIEEIKKIRKNKPIFPYNSSSDITEILNSQIAGMYSKYLQNQKEKNMDNSKVRINSYKLFFHRTQNNYSFNDLSKKCGVDRSFLRRLEKINTNKINLEPKLFPLCKRNDLQSIEKALDCPGHLEVGQENDFLSSYIQYYSVYKGKKPSIIRSQQQQLNLFPTKAIVFDFDGTLTKSKDNFTTWEKIWMHLGYDVNICVQYHRQFSEKKITHKKWCDITLKKFQEKDLTEMQLNYLSRDITLMPKTDEVVRALYNSGIKLFILSGSIRHIIKYVLKDLYQLFEDIKANELVFENGKLINIVGTKYDFKGKADFLKKIIKDNNYSPLEVLFIGNSCNDIFASLSGAKTLCINPHFTDLNNEEHWTYFLRKADDLSEIFSFAMIPSLDKTPYSK